MASAWETRFAEYVQRAMALRESGSLEVLHDLLPVLPVADPSAPELYRLRNERLIRATLQFTAAAGNLATIEIAPRAPNTLLVIDTLAFWIGAAGSVRVNCTNDTGFADQGSDVKDEPDSRWVGVGFPYAIGTVVTAAATLAEGGSYAIPASTTTLIVPVRYVLHPGFSLTVQNQTVAGTMTAMFAGYTRSVGASEARSMT